MRKFLRLFRGYALVFLLLCVLLSGCEIAQTVLGGSDSDSSDDSSGSSSTVSSLSFETNVDSITVSWELDLADDDEIYYQLRHSKSAYPTDVFDGSLVKLAQDIQSAVDSDLDIGTRYYYSLFYKVDASSDWEKIDEDTAYTLYTDEGMGEVIEDIVEYINDSDYSTSIIIQNGSTYFQSNGLQDDIDGYLQTAVNFGPSTGTAILEPDTDTLDDYVDDDVVSLMVDYCTQSIQYEASQYLGNESGYIHFQREADILTDIPAYGVYGDNDDNISALSSAANFFYETTPSGNTSALRDTLDDNGYDLIILNAFDVNGDLISNDDIADLQTDADGKERLLYLYVDIDKIYSNTDYWDSDWDTELPEWISESEDTPHDTQFWHPDWKVLLYNGEDSILSDILKLDLDGVVLGDLDAGARD